MRRLGMALALPLAEIAGFVLVGQWLGLLPVLGLVLLAAFVGVMLIRSTGTAAISHVQRAVRGRENPLTAAGAPAFRVIAGLLLIVPGFLTDLLALVLLLPPVQAVLLARVAAFAVAHRPRGGRSGPSDDRVIEGTAVEVAPPPGGASGGSGWAQH